MNQCIYLLLLSCLPLISSQFESPTCLKTGWSCRDCYTLKFCLGTTIWTNQSCTADIASNNAPYCDPDSNKCVSTEPEACRSIEPLQCFRNGKLPYIQNCSVYIECQDGNVTENGCEPTFFYKADWGKCVKRLSNGDCQAASCSTENQQVVLSDPSLYYDCKKLIPTLRGCPRPTQYYDVGSASCRSICNENTLGVSPNTQDCTSYYKCSRDNSVFTLSTVKCGEGKGFNSVTKQCERRYDSLCNELALLDSDIDIVVRNIPFIPFAPQVLKIFRNLFSIFKFNPITLLLNFNIKEQTVSTGILVVDYVLRNRRIPPAFINNAINAIINRLPTPIRNIINIILKFIPMPRLQRRSLFNPDLNIVTFLRKLLENLDIDIQTIYHSTRGKSLNQIGSQIFDYMVVTFDIPEENLMLIKSVVSENMYIIITFVNGLIGDDVFQQRDGLIVVDAHKISAMLDNIFNIFSNELLRIKYFSRDQLVSLEFFYESYFKGYIRTLLDGLLGNLIL